MSKQKITAGARFGHTVNRKPKNLSPIERKARGLLKSITDSTTARDRALGAAKIQAEKAEFYAGQVEEMTAELEALQDEESEGADA